MQLYKQMRTLGVLIWLTGCVRLYKDGSGFSYIFRSWHPLTWLIAVAMIIPCAIMGERLSEVVPVTLSKFWQANRDQLQWITPWTDTSTLKPFNNSANKFKYNHE